VDPRRRALHAVTWAAKTLDEARRRLGAELRAPLAPLTLLRK
jgi:hypothetical protein